jgi:hypothetical protein
MVGISLRLTDMIGLLIDVGSKSSISLTSTAVKETRKEEKLAFIWTSGPNLQWKVGK